VTRDAQRDPAWLEALPWLALAAACAPLLRGFPQGHDWSFELVRVAEYGRALATQWPPAWAENLYGGYGSPIFLFYAPLYAFVSSLLGGLLGAVERGAALALVLAGVTGVISMRRLAFLATGSRAASRVAATLFVLHPYLLCDALLRNANAEYLALCIAPAVAAGLLDLRTHPRRGACLLALSLALLVLAHNLTALFTTGMLAVAAAALYLPQNLRQEARRPVWIGLALGVATGVAVAAFFWLPALTLTPLVRSDDLLVGKFDFHRQFPDPLVSLFGYARFYASGVLPLCALLAAAAAAVWRRPADAWRRRLLYTVIAGAVFSLFMMTPASVVLWETIPAFPLFQFPWRLQGPLALLTALAAAIAFAAWLRGRPAAWQHGAEVGLALAALANALPHLLDARALEPRFAAALPRMLSAEGVRAGQNTATVLDEYLPRSANPQTWQRQPAGPAGVVGVTGGVTFEAKAERAPGIRLSATAPGPAHLRLGRWAFPGWELKVDGQARAVEPNRFGSIDAAVPAGQSEVRLRYRAPPARRLGLVLSGLGLAGLAGLAWRLRRR